MRIIQVVFPNGYSLDFWKNISGYIPPRIKLFSRKFLVWNAEFKPM